VPEEEKISVRAVLPSGELSLSGTALLCRKQIVPQNKLCVAAPLIFCNNNIKIGSTDGASRLRVQVTPEGAIFAVPEGRAADQGGLPSADLEDKQKMKFLERAREKLHQVQFVPGIGLGELGEKEQMKLFEEVGGK